MKITTSKTREHDLIREALSDIDIEELEFKDDPVDEDVIEIVIRGRFKDDAFTQTANKPRKQQDPFDDAKPF